jgi:hypothetical protein
MNHNLLERLSFLWSEARLVIAAAALFLGGVPPVLKILPGVPLVGSLLTLAWLISGIASLYLLYRWYTGGQTLFGGKETKDMVAFFVMTISGLNLGIAALWQNIGMSISSNYIIFLAVGILYLLAALHLYRRWVAHDESLF